ncbi:DUF2786 domain-containing protein [Jatrophihabitans sp. YIM 134969]
MPNPSQHEQVETELMKRAVAFMFGPPVGDPVAPLLAVPEDILRLAVARVTPRAVAAAVESGWRPSDLDQLRSRRLTGHAALCLLDVLGEVTAADGRLRTNPGWSAELRAVMTAVPAGAPRPRLADPADTRWAIAHIVETALHVLGALSLLPRLPKAAPVTVDEAGGAEAAMLVKVRALLVKAERTEFPHEAETYAAKAQSLMARHSIDAAMLSADGQAPTSGTALHRIWLDAPYVRAKFSIVSAVARANRCEALLKPGFDFASVVGMRDDVRATVMLATSLQLQAARGVARVRPDDGAWSSSVKTYRRSFLLAFADRIGERLREVRTEAEASADQDRLLPVLVDRKAAVDRAVAEAFPLMKTLRSTAALDPAGWAAGRAAADLARLGAATPLPRRS